MWKTNWILHILADLNLLYMELFLDQNSNANGCKTTGTLFLHKCILHTNWLLWKVFYVMNLLQLACTVHGSVLLQSLCVLACTEDQLLFELCLAPVLNLEHQLQNQFWIALQQQGSCGDWNPCPEQIQAEKWRSKFAFLPNQSSGIMNPKP